MGRSFTRNETRVAALAPANVGQNVVVTVVGKRHVVEGNRGSRVQSKRTSAIRAAMRDAGVPESAWMP